MSTFEHTANYHWLIKDSGSVLFEFEKSFSQHLIKLVRAKGWIMYRIEIGGPAKKLQKNLKKLGNL